MKLLIISVLALATAPAWAYSLKPGYVESMTYSQCKNDPTVRFVAGYYRQKYPSVSMNQILHLLCKDAK